jgi:hypothetical protein
MYSGGDSSSACGFVLPSFKLRFSVARLVRISFARFRAAIRCSRDRSGAVVDGLVAAGMGGDYTHAEVPIKAREAKPFWS